MTSLALRFSEWPRLDHSEVAAGIASLLTRYPGEPSSGDPSSARRKLLAALAPFRSESISPLDVSNTSRATELDALAKALLADLRDAPVARFADVCAQRHLALELIRAAKGSEWNFHPIVGIAWRDQMTAGISALHLRLISAEVVVAASEAPIRWAFGEVPAPWHNKVLAEYYARVAEVRASLSDSTTREEFGAIARISEPPPTKQLTEPRSPAPKIGSPGPGRRTGSLARVWRPLNEPALSKLRMWIGLALKQRQVPSVASVLAGIEPNLEALLLRDLARGLVYRPPTFPMLLAGHRLNPEFDRASRELVQPASRVAGLEKFRALFLTNVGNPLAKEWYAYALWLADRQSNEAEVVELLEQLTRAPARGVGISWTVRNDLALIEATRGQRNKALLDLLPAIEEGQHAPEVLDVGLRWAIETGNPELRDRLADISRYPAASLLAILAAARKVAASDTPDRVAVEALWQRLTNLFDEQGNFFDPPEPDARLDEDALDQIVWGFVHTGRRDAGLAYFRERLSRDYCRMEAKTWEAASEMAAQCGCDLEAWTYREAQWGRAQAQPAFTRPRNLDAILNAGLLLGRSRQALAMLDLHGRRVGLSAADISKWRARLVVEAKDVEKSMRQNPTASPTPGIETASAAIRDLRGSFKGVGSLEQLAGRAEDARRLLDATRLIHPELPGEPVEAIEAILAAAPRIGETPTDELPELARDLTKDLPALEILKDPKWYDLHGLAAASHLAVERLVASVNAFPDAIVEGPRDLDYVLGVGPESYRTRICVRVRNAAPFSLDDLQITFVSNDDRFAVDPEPVNVGTVEPWARTVVECQGVVNTRVPASVQTAAHVSYKIGSVPRKVKREFDVEIAEGWREIEGARRYVTSQPVRPDRKDLFRGRDADLRDLAGAFVDGRMKTLYFVNGIRGVGKTTLMENLSPHCGENVVPLVLNVEKALGEGTSTVRDVVQALMRRAIRDLQARGHRNLTMHEVPDSSLADDPWEVFEEFLERLREKTGAGRILLCLDELQAYVRKAQERSNQVGGGLLSWLRDKITTQSDLLIVCSGSEPYEYMVRRFEHPIWNKEMSRKDISFVSRRATLEIAEGPVIEDGVSYLDEAREALWDMSQGHPWVTQVVAEHICRILNSERRRVVLPGDVARAAGSAERERGLGTRWWNEKEGFLTAQHREVARLILSFQASARTGLTPDELKRRAMAANIGDPEPLLARMETLHVVELAPVRGFPHWRIRAGYLERCLPELLINARPTGDAAPEVFVGFDWENFWLRLQDSVGRLNDDARLRAEQHLADVTGLGLTLQRIASRRGPIRGQPLVVGDWSVASFRSHQPDLTRALWDVRYGASATRNKTEDRRNKPIRTDPRVIEFTHAVLKNAPTVGTFILALGDGDYGPLATTLFADASKRVVLWTTRDGAHGWYRLIQESGYPLTIEYIDELLFHEWGIRAYPNERAAH